MREDEKSWSSQDFNFIFISILLTLIIVTFADKWLVQIDHYKEEKNLPEIRVITDNLNNWFSITETILFGGWKGIMIFFWAKCWHTWRATCHKAIRVGINSIIRTKFIILITVFTENTITVSGPLVKDTFHPSSWMGTTGDRRIISCVFTLKIGRLFKENVLR